MEPPPRRPLYEESSQFKRWRFAPSKLVQLRAVLNERSIQIVRENLQAEKQASSSSSTTLDPPTPLDIQYLTPDDEVLLVSFYVSSIPRTCAGFGLPEVVEATAISYLKRFYLWNTCMDYHPRKVMPTCLFLACKTENCLIPIDTFISRFSKLESEEVLDLEFLVARSLKFDFMTWGAHKSLKGFALDLQTLPNTPLSTINTLIQATHPLIAFSRQTDLELTYAPSQIALAAMHQTNPELINTYLTHINTSSPAEGDKNPRTALPIPTDALVAILEDIKSVLREQGSKTLSMERVKEVDRRLRTCANPELIKGTALYTKRKLEEETESEEKRLKKADKAKEGQLADEAIFGGGLAEIPPPESRSPVEGDAFVQDVGKPSNEVEGATVVESAPGENDA